MGNRAGAERKGDYKIMNFDEIKNMSKKDFEQFIFKIQSSNQKFCVRCRELYNG